MTENQGSCSEKDGEKEVKCNIVHELDPNDRDSARNEKYEDDDNQTECSSDTASIVHDPEAGVHATGNESAPVSAHDDGNLVTWKSFDDPSNPKNWSKNQKWLATIMAAAFTLISPIASSMCAPALHSIAQDFGITSELESQLILSVFVLAYGFGPLLLGPLSEIYGRVIVLQTSNAFFAIFNLACGFAQNKNQMIAFRFLAGVGGSAPLAIGGAIIGDCWWAHERGRAMAVFSMMPLLATAVGPVAGAFVTDYASWRWIFWSITIASVIVQLFGIFLLKETFTPEILRIKKMAMMAKTGNNDLYTEFERNGAPLLRHMGRALERPCRLLSTLPILQFMAIYIAYIYGLIYLVMSTFPPLWTSPSYYEESISTGGLNYISLALGYFVGSQISAILNDKIYLRLKRRSSNSGRPEFRIPLMIPFSLVTPIGLLLYGWTAETRQHWILPNIGAFVFAVGSIVVFQCIQVYLVDCYTHYAASALAAAVVLRSLCGFAYPLFAPYMYDSLGYGWGNSVLALVAIVIGLPAPIILWRYGQSLRAKSRYCASS